MKSEHLSGDEGSCKSKRSRAAKPKNDLDCVNTLINVVRSGDWMPAEELWEAAKAALDKGKDVTLNLDKVDHLDASALQILLSLDVEQKKLGRQLQLVNASPNLCHWFDYAGAVGYFPVIEPKSNE